MARIAKSLDRLRTQVNDLYPFRSKVSDGWIGDAAHAAGKSDHNANPVGVVCALDITHDPRPGVGPDTWRMAEILRLNRDPRVKYVISNGRIFSSKKAPWVWRTYSGSNKHDKHIHVSVGRDPGDDDYEDNALLYDDEREWDLTPPETGVEAPPVDMDVVRKEMAARIVDFEAKRDKSGRIEVHEPGDGSYEIAGITSTHHEPEASALRTLINAGKHKEAEVRAGEYIIRYTDPVTGWTTHPGLEFYLRDSFFNRGPTGAAIILQKALGVEEDGQVGPTTRGALNAANPDALLLEIRKAREEYEIKKYGKREHYWKGLTNRWNNALKTAQAFSAATKPEPIKPKPVEPEEVKPVEPVESVTAPFIVELERLVAEINGQKNIIAAAMVRLRSLSEELKRHVDEGIK